MLSVLGSASSAQAQVIKAIDVQALTGATVADGVILANMQTKVGDTLDDAVLGEDLERLQASGLVEMVDFLQEPLDGGVLLIVAVEARSKLREVLFIGNAAISTKKLRNHVELAPGQQWDDRALRQAHEDIVALYQKKGYSEIDVSHSVDVAEDGFSRITFSIDEGQRLLLDRIVIVGNTVFSDRELTGGMKSRERRLLRLFGKRGKIDNQVVEDDVLAIEGRYRDAGYINARVTDVERRQADREGNFDLVLAISEGELHSVSAVSVSGTEAVSSEAVSAELQMQPGKPYSAKAVREDVGFLREYYGRRGYLNLHVRPILTSAGENALDIEYSVYEGSPFKVGEVKITGNAATQDRVIRRELAVFPGEQFNTALLEASAARVRKLPNFSRVETSIVDSAEEGFKDIHISLTEQPTGEIKFGGGFSSVDNVVGFISLTQRNFDLTNWPKFTGAGQKVRLNLQYGARRRDFEFDFTEPWLFGNDLALNTGVYHRDIFYNSDLYDERHTGGHLSFRKRVGEHSSVTAGYKLDFGKVHNIDADASEEIAAEAGDFTDSVLFAEYNITTVDSFLFPRRGHTLNLRTEFSGLGGDVNTYAFEMRGAKYYHLPLDTVFHLEGAFRTIDSHGSGGVPIYKREFLGSANNLRGYDYREVGPKDETGEPLGGLTSLYGTAEVSTPLPGKLGKKVRFATFLDAGTVSDSPWGVDDVYGDVGVGVRLFLFKNSPPVRIDYAFPLKTDDFNGTGGKINFRMGFKF